MKHSRLIVPRQVWWFRFCCFGCCKWNFYGAGGGGGGGGADLGEEGEEELDAADGVERVVHRVGDDGLDAGEHERVRRVDEVGGVALGRRLQAQLAVGGHGVVHEDDGAGQSAVVEDAPLVLGQVHRHLVLETELTLVARSQPVHGADVVRRQGLAEQVDGCHLAAEQPVVVQLRRGADETLVERLRRRDRPRHLRRRRQLAVDEHLDLALGPPVVDVHHGQHVPAPRLELVLHAVLEPAPCPIRFVGR